MAMQCFQVMQKFALCLYLAELTLSMSVPVSCEQVNLKVLATSFYIGSTHHYTNTNFRWINSLVGAKSDVYAQLMSPNLT